MFSPEPASDDVSASFGQPLGQVVSVRGSRARLGLLVPPIEDLEAVRATVGKFLGILTTESLLIGVITNVSIEPPACADERQSQSTADLDLIGEIRHSGAPARFQRGMTSYRNRRSGARHRAAASVPPSWMRRSSPTAARCLPCA